MLSDTAARLSTMPLEPSALRVTTAIASLPGARK
jgi:hypothetical protein